MFNGANDGRSFVTCGVVEELMKAAVVDLAFQ